jgi:hypothetical protein
MPLPKAPRSPALKESKRDEGQGERDEEEGPRLRAKYNKIRWERSTRK